MSSVPLAALAVQPQQPIDPLSQYAKVLQIKSLLGQQSLQPGQLQQQQANLQATQQENQQRALQIKSQQGVSQALVDSKGDKDTFFKNVQDPKYGVMPSDQFAIQQKYQEMADALAKTDKDTLSATQDAHTQITQHLNNVLQAPPEDQAAQYQLEYNAIRRDPTLAKYAQGIPPQFPGAQQLTTVENGMKLSSQVLAEAKAGREAPGEIASSQQKEQEAALGPAGRAAMTNPTLQAQQASGMNPFQYEKYIKTLPMTVQQQLLSPEAREMAATMYQQTGTLPQGMRSPAMSAGILNQAAAGGPQNIAGAKATYAANADSLKSLQKNFDQVTAFENTAGKNLDQFLSVAKSVVDSGSPLINKPLRSVADKVAGSPNQAAFDAARVTALTEIAKVLNSSNASGVLSDSARSEVSGLIGKDATLAQIYKAAQILKTDMGNRHDAYQQQITDIKGRLGSGGQQQAPASQAQSNSGMVTMRAPNGQTKQVPSGQVEHYKQMGATVIE